MGIEFLHITSNNKFLISVSMDKTIKIFDISNQTCWNENPIIEYDTNFKISVICIDSKEKLLYIGTENQEIKIIDLTWF